MIVHQLGAVWVICKWCCVGAAGGAVACATLRDIVLLLRYRSRHQAVFVLLCLYVYKWALTPAYNLLPAACSGFLNAIFVWHVGKRFMAQMQRRLAAQPHQVSTECVFTTSGWSDCRNMVHHVSGCSRQPAEASSAPRSSQAEARVRACSCMPACNSPWLLAALAVLSIELAYLLFGLWLSVLATAQALAMGHEDTAPTSGHSGPPYYTSDEWPDNTRFSSTGEHAVVLVTLLAVLACALLLLMALQLICVALCGLLLTRPRQAQLSHLQVCTMGHNAPSALPIASITMLLMGSWRALRRHARHRCSSIPCTAWKSQSKAALPIGMILVRCLA